MNKKVDMFEFFANLADMDISPTEKVGRYKSMKEKELNIFKDIYEKLNLSDKNIILDIGCGCGSVLYRTIDYILKNNKNIYLNDSKKVLNQVIKKFDNHPNIKFIDGKFPDVKLDNNIKFDAIILYSIIHYIDEDNIFNFLDYVLDRLQPKGSLLIGDIPNIDKKERFNKSNFGRLFNAKWQENQNSCYISSNYPTINLRHFDDGLILAITKYIRSKETFNAYILPQNSKLPFGYIRDDILVERT
tara:strand:- start:350 stop:1084 length:735 start_codon:yes stop_codon:yes gene_type:complete